MLLRAVRGASTIHKDEAAAIVSATEEMLLTLMEKNQIQPQNIVSIFFTTTPDIISEFPAVAARKIGLVDTPLMCAQEIPKPGALPLCIRALIYFYTDLQKSEVKPVYLREAVKLRPDLTVQE